MRMGVIAMMIATIGLNVGMGGCVQNASEKSTSTLSMAKRTMEETITGRVESVTGRMHDLDILIKMRPEETRLVHTDEHTIMDNVAIGDRVKAFVTTDGYAAIIEHKGRMPPHGGYSLMGSGAP